MRRCGQCGAPVEGRYCTACGSPVPPEPPIQVPASYPTGAYAVAPTPPVPPPMSVQLGPPPTALGSGPPQPPRRSPRALWALIGAATGVALIVAAWFGLQRAGLLPSAPASTAARPTVEGSQPASPSQSPAQPPQTSAQPPPTSQAPQGFPDVVVPVGSKECARTGTGPFAAVGTANETTSCPFAINVQEAYVAAGLNGRNGSVKAFSPATGITYDLTCSGSQPVLCTGGVAARVVIYGGQLRATG